MQDIIKIDQKQMKQELENRNWSDRSSRSTTTTPLATIGAFTEDELVNITDYILYDINHIIL